MRHRQTTGAGPSGTRPGLAVLALTVAGGGLAAAFGQPGGVWAGYGAATVAALIGCVTVWRQRGLLDRHAEEIASRRRTDLDEAALAVQQSRAELDRVRAELDHEQQYSILIQDQLSRARELLERERTARRAAERELDALTGATGWPAAKPSVKANLEQPATGRVTAAKAQEPGVPVKQASAEEPQTAGSPGPALSGLSAAQRRGWQVVDGDAEDDADSFAAETDRLYRPFIDHLAAAAVPVSDAALAMAPVIGAVASDDVLDLTAYDETVEFSVREIKRMA